MWSLLLASAFAAPPAAPDPAVFDGTWLVIVASKATPDELDQELARLANVRGVVVEPVWLSSSQFDALVPCWEILAAKAFRAKADAVAYAARLKDAGVDAYPRRAGRYVAHPAAVCAPPPVEESEGC